jgi:hypothetical protein
VIVEPHFVKAEFCAEQKWQAMNLSLTSIDQRTLCQARESD